MITSTSNIQVKNLIQLQKKAKARNAQDVFVVEGIRMFREVPKDRVVKVYCSEGFYEKARTEAIFRELESKTEILSDRIFESVSDTKTPQGILVVVKQYHYSVEEILQEKKEDREKPFLVVLEDLQDPGNLGTIFRTAEGAGVDAVLLSKESVDLYNPKTIRSTMGSIYRMPFVYCDDLPAEMERLKEAGIYTYAAHLDQSVPYDAPDYTMGCAFLIGNEGNGLSDRLTGLAQQKIRIPMKGKLESLNAAMAAGILMYEARRQREK